MKSVFNLEKRHHITEANFNYYANPFVHPKRKMKEHDFVYLINGKWKIGQNNSEYELEEDTLLILNGDNTHYGVLPCEKDTRTMYFHVTMNDGDYIETTEGNTAESSVKVNTVTSLGKNEYIKEMFREIVNNTLSGNSMKADILFDLLLCEMSAFSESVPKESIGERIKEIIHKNPERFFSNREIADMLNVSVKTAETKFKKLTGMSIHQYMLGYKIDQAKEYFRNFPEMSIKEISFNLGFYDEYHFGKQFKKLTGISPGRYKMQK